MAEWLQTPFHYFLVSKLSGVQIPPGQNLDPLRAEFKSKVEFDLFFFLFCVLKDLSILT